MSLHVDIKKKLASFDLEVSLDAEAETIGFLGESGCGKSMTMRCIAGIETPDEGVITVNGKTYFDSSAKINLKTQERKTALLFQNYMLFPHMTVGANILSGVDRNLSSAEKDRILEEQLEHFSLTGLDKRYPLQLSGGQQQRVALARMMAAKPGILMLDEPFSALDAHLKGLLEQNLVSLFDEFDGSILYVSHDIDEAIRFCDRICVVEEGHIMEIATGRELVHSPQSIAGIKLSGCKNAHTAEKRGEHKIFVPAWGVELETEQVVPDDIKAFGIRSFYLEQVDGPGPNVYEMRVDRASDSRFERTLLLDFCRKEREGAGTSDQMDDLREHVYRFIDLMEVPEEKWPNKGDHIFMRFPPDKFYLVSK